MSRLYGEGRVPPGDVRKFVERHALQSVRHNRDAPIQHGRQVAIRITLIPSGEGESEAKAEGEPGGEGEAEAEAEAETEGKARAGAEAGVGVEMGGKVRVCDSFVSLRVRLKRSGQRLQKAYPRGEKQKRDRSITSGTDRNWPTWA